VIKALLSTDISPPFCCGCGCGCGCGCDDGEYHIQRRINADGQVEISDDGGLSWELDPNGDVRNFITLFPPRDEGETDGECLAAENIAYKFKELMDTIFAQLAAGGGAAGAAPAVIAVLVTIGFPTGLGAVLALIYGLISALIGLVSAGLEGSFDTAFWADFKCYWYCVVDADGTVTQDDIDYVYERVAERWGTPNPIANKVIADMMEVLGANGITNAARMDNVVESSCETCECPACGDNYEIYNHLPGDYGTIIDIQPGWIDVAPGVGGYMTISTITPGVCCYVTGQELISGGPGELSAFKLCGTGYSAPFIPNTPIGNCCEVIEAQFTGYGVLRIFLDECPP